MIHRQSTYSKNRFPYQILAQLASQFLTVCTKVQQAARQLHQVVVLMDIFNSPTTCWTICNLLIINILYQERSICLTSCATIEHNCQHRWQKFKNAIGAQLARQLKFSRHYWQNGKHFKKTLFSIVLFPSLAFSSWYDQKLEGWYYFQDQKIDPQTLPTPHSLEEADELLAQESQKLKQLLSLAILSPTKENIENYIRNQRYWLTQSSSFAQAWGKTLLEHPELGEFLTTPTSTYGILAKRAHDLKRRVDLLQTLAKDHFLVFFFKGHDPLAQKVAEVAKLFASTNGWKYKAVSLDGAPLPQLQEFAVDRGLSQNFGVQVSPSLYVVNPKENQIYPVGAGLISVSELEANIEIQLGETRE